MNISRILVPDLTPLDWIFATKGLLQGKDYQPLDRAHHHLYRRIKECRSLYAAGHQVSSSKKLTEIVYQIAFIKDKLVLPPSSY